MREEISELKYHLIQLSLALMVIILFFMGRYHDLIAVFTIITGSSFVILLNALYVISKLRSVQLVRYFDQYFRSALILASLLPVAGMFFGSFSPAFSIPVPFGFYLIFALIITLQLLLSVYMYLWHAETRTDATDESTVQMD